MHGGTTIVNNYGGGGALMGCGVCYGACNCVGIRHAHGNGYGDDGGFFTGRGDDGGYRGHGDDGGGYGRGDDGGGMGMGLVGGAIVGMVRTHVHIAPTTHTCPLMLCSHTFLAPYLASYSL